MITTDMILNAKKRLKRIIRAKAYRDTMRKCSKERRQFLKAALTAKILNDMEDGKNETCINKH